MASKRLTHKPLVEAVFELRWDLQDVGQGVRIDPHNKILPGVLFEKLKGDYPAYEILPAANMPDELSRYIVQHRFRRDQKQWPLIQIGQGIFTFNETDNYEWGDFNSRVIKAISILFENYPEPSKFNINGLILRYIDAVDIDFKKENILDFLRKELKLNFEINESIFNGTGVVNVPSSIDMRVAFPVTKPAGEIKLRFAKGKKLTGEKGDALIWEMVLNSVKTDTPKNVEGIKQWINEAHCLIEKWFFRMIEGNLEARFR